MKRKIMKGAEPFYYKKGRTGVLLLHGFTSTPQEVKALGRYLAEKNISVLAPLLPGHGTKPEDLENCSRNEWIAKSLINLEILKKRCDKIYLVGNSMGGNIALCIGHRKDISGIVSLGTPVVSTRIFFIRLALPFVRLFTRFVKKRYRSKVKPIVAKKVQYKVIPLDALPEVIELVKATKSALRNIRKPILIMQSLDDFQLTTHNAHVIYNNVKSKVKKLVFIPDSYHVFVMDKHRKMAFKEIYNFIQQNGNNNS